MKTFVLIFMAVLMGGFCRAAEQKAAKPEDNKAVVAKEEIKQDVPLKAGVTQEVIEEGTAEAAVSESDMEHTYFDEFMHKMEQGGFTMKILLVLSVLGIAKIFERLVNLNRSTMTSPRLAEEADSLFRQGKYEELRKKCLSDKSILGRIVLAMVDHRDCSKGDIQSITDDIGSRELRIQMQKAYPLAIVATLSPLLGLFGTVLGMIGAFDTVAQAGDMGNASILADDIATALVTTGGGLAVAIPMLGFYHFFRTRTNKFAIILEEEVSTLYSAWFLRAPSETQPNAAATPAQSGNVSSAPAGEGKQ